MAELSYAPLGAGAAQAVPRGLAAPVRELALAAGVWLALVVVAAANGGYFPTSWGWASLAFAWAAILVLLLAREVELTWEGVTLLGGLTLLAGWTALSALWSVDRGASVLETERVLVYTAGVAALLLAVRGRSQRLLLGSILAAVSAVCAYSLATRLFPAHVGRFDSTAGYRLYVPVGYWNSLGLFAAMGCLLALGFAARARSLAGRAGAGAALVVLAPTLYFTFSRGSWLALAVGLAVALAFDPRRLQATLAIAAVLPAPALALLLAWRSPALTTVGTPLARAVHEGHRLALAVAVLAVLAAALAVGFALLERRLAPGALLRRSYAAALGLAVLVAAGGVWLHWGSPPRLAQRAWHSFASPPPQTGANLNARLFHLSNNGRVDLWRAALDEFRTARVAGTGAGTYELWWDEHRPAAMQVRDAHSLYLQTLAELGVVGLALLLLVVAAPLVGAWRGRRRPLTPFAAAAFAACAVHAGVDWDWEVAAVTLVALACGVACTQHAAVRARALRLPVRFAGVAVALAVAAAGLLAAVGNRALANADTAVRLGRFGQAEADARSAARWMPWSSDPWIVVGQIEAISFRRGEARASFERAIARSPHDYLAWYGLAGVETGAARRYAAAQVVRLNPLSAEAAEMRPFAGS